MGRGMKGLWSPITLCLIMAAVVNGYSKNFVNSSMPEMRPTFVVNFDMSTVICQHSADPTDLHLHEMSILCDGKSDCYLNPAMNDESFPYCERKCNSTCNNRGACLYDGEKPQCYCNSGFSGATCEFADANECLDRPCHLMAHCTNIPGAFSCQCFPGFTGDGYHCADIDECLSDKIDCPQNSICVNLPGTHYCNCTAGYSQKGEHPHAKCVDIDECSKGIHDCKTNEICENTVGSFNCVSKCSEGYQYRNGKCVDLDECRLENICDPRAECINLPGSYKCVCEDGLEGDGKKCDPVSDCTQKDDLCDRHALCIPALKMCYCQAGYAGDGITCNDVNECEAIDNPCQNQNGDRCVNIEGGYICCNEDQDDERCIQAQGAFCSGGCGLNAFCANQTCQCQPGFIGDPSKKCLDVNECEVDNICSGVGQWCINVLGSFLCCGPDSKEVECQGAHIFKTLDGHDHILEHNSSSAERWIGASGSAASKSGSVRVVGQLPSVSASSKRPCTSYCPLNSECVEGFCICSEGYGGNPNFGCEDINECLSSKPCLEDNDHWCVNTDGGFTCCNANSTQSDCIGLEISPSGLRLTGNLLEDGETVISASLNESIGSEIVSHHIQESRNFSEGGHIILVKSKVNSGESILSSTTSEKGVEILSTTPGSSGTSTFILEATTQLPGVVSRLGGTESAFTTSIPISEIPVHPTDVPLIIEQLKKDLINQPDSLELKVGGDTSQIPAKKSREEELLEEIEGSGSDNSDSRSFTNSSGGSFVVQTGKIGSPIHIPNVPNISELLSIAREPTNNTEHGDGNPDGTFETIKSQTGGKILIQTGGKGSAQQQIILPNGLPLGVKPTGSINPASNVSLPTAEKVEPNGKSNVASEGRLLVTSGGNGSIPSEEQINSPHGVVLFPETNTTVVLPDGSGSTITKSEGTLVFVGRKPDTSDEAVKTEKEEQKSLANGHLKVRITSVEETTTPEIVTDEVGLEIVHTAATTPEVEVTDKLVGDSQHGNLQTTTPHATNVGSNIIVENGQIILQKGPEVDLEGSGFHIETPEESEELPNDRFTTVDVESGELGLEIIATGPTEPASSTSSPTTLPASSTTNQPDLVIVPEDGFETRPVDTLVKKPQNKEDSVEGSGDHPDTDITETDGNETKIKDNHVTKQNRTIITSSNEVGGTDKGLIDGESSEFATGEHGTHSSTPSTTEMGLEIVPDHFSSTLTPDLETTEEVLVSVTGHSTSAPDSTESTTTEAAVPTSTETVSSSTGTSKSSSGTTSGSTETTSTPSSETSTTPTGEVSSSTESSSTSTGATSNVSETLPTTTEVASTDANTISSSTEAVSASTEAPNTSSESPSSSTEATSTISSTESVSTSTEKVLGSSETPSTTTQVTSTDSDVTSTTETVLASTESTVSSTEGSSTSTEVSSNSTEAVSTTTEATLNTTVSLLPASTESGTSSAGLESTTEPIPSSTDSSITSTEEPSGSTSASNVTNEVSITTEATTSSTGSSSTIIPSVTETTKPQLQVESTSTEPTTSSATEGLESTSSPESVSTTTKVNEVTETVTNPSTTLPGFTGTSAQPTGAEVTTNSAVSASSTPVPEVAEGSISSSTAKPEEVNTDSTAATDAPSVLSTSTHSSVSTSGATENPVSTSSTVVEVSTTLASTTEESETHAAVTTDSTPTELPIESTTTSGDQKTVSVKQERQPTTESFTQKTLLEVTTLEETTTPQLATLPTIIDEEDPSDVSEKDEFALTTTSTSRPATLGPNNTTKCVSADECGDDAQCERRTGACRCYPGFEGSPPSEKCRDVDECAEGLHKCDISARCHNFNGGYACFCPMGYRKNEAGECVDINECFESRGTCCSSNGTCVNKPGTYGCECKPGFTGDGYNCMPIEKHVCKEAELEKAKCGNNHICMIDIDGTFDCDACRMGFHKVNGSCSDINECANVDSHMCDSNAHCNNLLGTYACQCKEGFRGDGFKCEDIDECSESHSHCHPQATCTNTIGSHNCDCPDGFVGDGKVSCQNPNENSCENLKQFCGRSEHTSCLSVRIFNGSLTSICECEPGYRYNSIKNTCEDIDECNENRHNCDPASAVCVNTDGDFFCECAEGYDGVGGVCVDVNECERGLAGCHSMAMCINQPGSCGCKCMEGFTGDGIQCTSTTPDDLCTTEWQRLCRLENKTCHIDEEDVPQCGSCIEGHHPTNGSCQPVEGAGNCADRSMNKCHQNAECIDVQPGRHFCTCKVGYIGDGMRCDGPNCHLDAGLCHEKASCQIDGNCKCDAGFEGDGITSCEESKSLTTRGPEPPVQSRQNATTQSPTKITNEESRGPPSMTPPSLIETSETTSSPDNIYTGTSEPQEESTVVVSTVSPTTTTTTTAATTTSIDDIEIHNNEFHRAPSDLPQGICSEQDRSQCHALAICHVSSGVCRCKDGFEGDGYSSCKRIDNIDCVKNSSICHSSATCDRHTRRCECPIGHIGDGILCSPDPQDCLIRDDLCSSDAICSGRRCQCVEGFTGDGIKCVSIHQRSSNCSECDFNAHCASGICECNIGYFGNGLCCVPDPRDCIHFPGVCHPSADCNNQTRQCSCHDGYLGDGIQCLPKLSCRSDSSVCHKNAICLPSGQCICQHGYEGNGHHCAKISASSLHRPALLDSTTSCEKPCDDKSEVCVKGNCQCKNGFERNANGKCQDIDECKGKNTCHHLAICHNQPGSYRCQCPEDYVGDGTVCVKHIRVGELSVFCEPDGMTLVLGNDTELFEGRIFVRGQAENPHCSKMFSSLQQNVKPYTFKVPFEHCNVQLENHDTFAATVIVQKHPMFITTAADAYDLKCTYPTGVREVESHVNVSELATSSTLSDKSEGPLCKISVMNERDESINAATVGQALRLRLEVSPNRTYSILPRNCFAINIESGERYSLTDKAGCAIDDQLFPEWIRVRPSVTEAVFKTFKWPDSSIIRFQCDCSACVGECPPIDCDRRREAAMRKFRFRRAHSDNETEAIDNEDDEEGFESELINSNRMVFSSLVQVHEDDEQVRAEEQVESWRRGSPSGVVMKSTATLSESVCIRTVLLIISALSTAFCCGFLVILLIIRCRRRQSRIPKDVLSTDSPISVLSF